MFTETAFENSCKNCPKILSGDYRKNPGTSSHLYFSAIAFSGFASQTPSAEFSNLFILLNLFRMSQSNPLRILSPPKIIEPDNNSEG